MIYYLSHFLDYSDDKEWCKGGFLQQTGLTSEEGTSLITLWEFQRGSKNSGQSSVMHWQCQRTCIENDKCKISTKNHSSEHLFAPRYWTPWNNLGKSEGKSQDFKF